MRPPSASRSAVVGLEVALVVSAAATFWVWSGPHADVPVPGPDATPEQTVRAYVRALDARDFDTVNAIDPSSPPLRRFDDPGRIDDLHGLRTFEDQGRVHVVFRATFRPSSGGEGGVWGYLLERGADGRWVIVDRGVA